MAEKLFYTMGEVAEMFDVNASLIRYWGTQFPSLKPQRNKKGNRLFTPEDIETLKRIYHYVKECGMTLDGAKKALRGNRSSAPEGGADMELLDRLHTLRSMLVAVRDSLTDDAPTTDVAEEPKAETVEVVAQSAPEQPQRPIYKEQTLFDF
jgi:DNA-binding transcriptional MerR regulator